MLLVIKAPSIDLSALPSSAGTAPSDTVAQLTAALRRGDEDAYREFFHRYFHRLLAYLVVLTRGNEQLARDLLQQTMIKVAKNIRVFDDDTVFWRWLTLVARTAAIDHSRKTQRYLGFLQRLWSSRNIPPPAPSDDESIFAEALRGSLELLAPEDRSLLEKKYIDGISMKELAAELALSEKAVESRLTRARAKLKEQLLERLRHE